MASEVAVREALGAEASIHFEPEWCWHCVDKASEHYRSVTGESLWMKAGVAAPRSPRQAADVFRKLGVRNLKDAFTQVLGEPVNPKLAMRGDLVMVNNALGICRGEWVECADAMQPLRLAECAWHCG